MKMPISTGGKFIKGSDLDNGLTLTITAEPELTECNPKYGFTEGPNKGKTVRYHFGERIFDSKSSRFASAISRFEVGDTVHIKRNLAGTETSFSIVKADPKETPLENIPF